jgi:hypothetical protein
MARVGMNEAAFEVVEEDAGKVVLRDVGPWSQHPTITNDAEQVVEKMAARVGCRRLLYYDSEGELTELVHDGPRFVRFAFVKVRSEDSQGGRD